jgi:hypothetical protein
MSAAFFLLLAAVISIVGSTVIYLRQRPPRSVEANIDSFRHGLDALAPSEKRR